MTHLLIDAAFILLVTIAASLARVLRGPGDADRMMEAQIATTCGVAILLLLSTAAGDPAIIEVALVLALLAALAEVEFVKSASPDEAGHQEEIFPR